MIGFRTNLLRPASGPEAHRVSYLELFFDLVFVFAITQVSHLLIAHPSAEGLVQTLIVALSVWWVWVYTTWAANWLNPETGWVRALFVGMMLLGIVMSASIPEAFGDKGTVFAVSMVAFNVGRSVFTVFAFARSRPDNAVNFIRIAIWNAAPGALWIAGSFVEGEARLPIWLVALLVDYLGPRIRFWVPRMGRSAVSTWNVTGEHFSERVNLFIIIALGESIIITGSQFSEQPFTATSLSAFLSAFASTVLMFFLYFNHGERGGSRYLTGAADARRGLVAQIAYTYVPVLLILGIVLTAVADELVLAHPLGIAEAAGMGGGHAVLPFAAEAGDGVSSGWIALIVCIAAALYLLGNLFFKRATGLPWLWSHVLGVVVLAVILALHQSLTPLAINWLTDAVLLAVVVADEVAFRRTKVVEASR